MQEAHFIAGSLKIYEKKIQEALNTLHGTPALVLKICCSMEEKSSMEDMEKIQKEIPNTKGNIQSLISDRDYLLDIFEMYHAITLKYVEENDNLTKELKSTHDSLESFQKALQ